MTLQTFATMSLQKITGFSSNQSTDGQRRMESGRKLLHENLKRLRTQRITFEQLVSLFLYLFGSPKTVVFIADLQHNILV